jgi:hypothetical protein
MSDTNEGGGYHYAFDIAEVGRRATVTDTEQLFPGGSWDFPMGEAVTPTFVYRAPEGVVQASRVMGSAVARVEVAGDRPIERTSMRVYQDVAEERTSTETAFDPNDPDRYATSNQFGCVNILAQCVSSEFAAELVGLPKVDVAKILDVIAGAYAQPTPLEAAQFALDGLRRLTPQ